MTTRYPIRIPETLADPGPPALTTSAIRFTLDGSDELENRLDQTCQRVLAALLDLLPEKKLEAILLGGSYGRGEGGVLQTTAGDHPYGSMRFYVCLRGSRVLNEQTLGPALDEAARELSSIAGINLQFQVFSLAWLRRHPVEMFSHDLVMRHRWLWGSENLLKDCDHHRQETDIPLSEATRLLMNRCSGLLFAREMVGHDLFAIENSDYITRTLARLQLALGDALLTVYGRYHWSCRERFERLRQFTPNKDLPWLREIQRHHAEGVSFALHPRRQLENSEQLQATHAELSSLALRLWLWIEGRRLNCPFLSARDYAFNSLNKCPETKPWRNHVANVWHFGTEMILNPRSLRNPRERLLRSLVLLLWEPAVLSEPALLHRVQRDVQTYSNSFGGLVAAYKKMWEKFN